MSTRILSQSLKDQGKSRTSAPSIIGRRSRRNPLKIRASLGPLLDTLKMVGGSQSLKDQGKSRTPLRRRRHLLLYVAIP